MSISTKTEQSFIYQHLIKRNKNIGKLKDFKNLTTLSIKSYNIEETALKNLIKELPKLSKIIIDTNKFIDLGGISNEIRQYGGSQKIETIIQDVNLEDVFTKIPLTILLKLMENL